MSEEVVKTEEQEEVVLEGDLQSPQVREKVFHNKKGLVEWLSYTTAVEIGMKLVRNQDGSIKYLIQYKEGA